MQIHVTSLNAHQLILEATVGGEAGDIAIDDVSLTSGLCPTSGNKDGIMAITFWDRMLT